MRERYQWEARKGGQWDNSKASPALYADVSDGQVLRVANFPDHAIKRMSDGEWVMENEHVIFVSCGTNDVPRSFPMLRNTPCWLDSTFPSEADGEIARRNAATQWQAAPKPVGPSRIVHMPGFVCTSSVYCR